MYLRIAHVLTLCTQCSPWVILCLRLRDNQQQQIVQSLPSLAGRSTSILYGVHCQLFCHYGRWSPSHSTLTQMKWKLWNSFFFLHCFESLNTIGNKHWTIWNDLHKKIGWTKFSEAILRGGVLDLLYMGFYDEWFITAGGHGTGAEPWLHSLSASSIRVWIGCNDDECMEQQNLFSNYFHTEL